MPRTHRIAAPRASMARRGNRFNEAGARNVGKRKIEKFFKNFSPALPGLPTPPSASLWMAQTAARDAPGRGRNASAERVVRVRGAL